MLSVSSMHRHSTAVVLTGICLLVLIVNLTPPPCLGLVVLRIVVCTYCFGFQGEDGRMGSEWILGRLAGGL
jgi:hypothetical protein